MLQGKQENKSLTSNTPPVNAAESRAAQPASGADNAAQAALTNPAFIEFEVHRVGLSSQAQALITKLAAPAKRSHKIVITGYCDKRKADNAKQVAISRAAKVKNELVKNGIAAGNIRVKYITGQSRNMAKVDLRGEPLRVDNSAGSTTTKLK